jgi:hypothetical protein
MTTKFGWTWMLVGCAAVAGAVGAKTFRIQDSVLLFGDYNELRIVTAEEERLVHPPVNVKYNGGYFAFPSLAPRGDFVAWGFATEAQVAWPDVRIRFALGVYSVAQQRWKTYGDFETIGDAAISPDGANVAVVAGQREAPRLQILDLARETFIEAASPRGLPEHAYLSWSPDGARISTVLERGEKDPVIAIVDLATGHVRELTQGFAARWSPDGQWIAYYPTDDQCMLVHPDGTGVKRALKLKDSWFASKHFGWGAPVWSPDSRQLLFNVVKNDGPALDVVLLDVATGRTTTTVTSGFPVFGWARRAK